MFATMKFKAFVGAVPTFAYGGGKPPRRRTSDLLSVSSSAGFDPLTKRTCPFMQNFMRLRTYTRLVPRNDRSYYKRVEFYHVIPFTTK